MKKDYLKPSILFYEHNDDVITMSVGVEWDDDWGDDWNPYS